MKRTIQRSISIFAITLFGIAAVVLFGNDTRIENAAFAQATATPTPAPAAVFDQKAALAKLREQIKGRENEPAEKVFKNVTTPMLKSGPAGRLLAVMELGFARSLGVNCTHCHVADKWESEEKPQKQIARDMSAMMARINSEMLKGIKNLANPQPTVNCTTCHRGEVKPALNLPSVK